jgi:hypothetical protein
MITNGPSQPTARCKFIVPFVHQDAYPHPRVTRCERRYAALLYRKRGFDSRGEGVVREGVDEHGEADRSIMFGREKGEVGEEGSVED